MRSPSAIRNEPRRAQRIQDKAGGLGYNRDLIGAAQALRSDLRREQIHFDLVNAARSIKRTQRVLTAERIARSKGSGVL
jgi:hypothetical protein